MGQYHTDVDLISPDEITFNDDDTITISFPEDVSQAHQLYIDNPLFKWFVNRELEAFYRNMGIDDAQLNKIPLLGILYMSRGMEITLSKDHSEEIAELIDAHPLTYEKVTISIESKCSCGGEGEE